jgi:hypothetical protein
MSLETSLIGGNELADGNRTLSSTSRHAQPTEQAPILIRFRSQPTD